MTLNNIPPGWTSWSSLVPQTNGKSGAIVYRAGAGHLIKSELISPLAKLPGEVARLRWLSSIGLPCPEVVDALDHGDRHWLLMTAVPGRDLASTDDLAAETAVTLVAQALRMLHDVDPEICPFDHRSAVRAAAATANLQAGLYDGGDPSFGPASHERLLATRPINEDLVVTHGDAKFSKLHGTRRSVHRLIDCGRLGVADRYQDIALACRSLERNFGAAAIPAFFSAYGIAEPDAEKLAWYNLLDEFF